MEIITRLFLLVLAVGLVSTGTALSLSTATEITDGKSNTCVPKCTAGISKSDVVFTENVKYKYEFRGQTTIITPTDTKDGMSKMSIKGMVYIIGMPSCGAILYLKNVEIKQGSKVYDGAILRGRPILFTYNNGKISPFFESFDLDSVASLNLKRALLSALQVSLIPRGGNGENEVLETDVQGTCNTLYSLNSLNPLTVTKDRDLTLCKKHEKISQLGMSSSPQSNPNLPFLSANHHSDILIEDSTIKSVVSQDSFLYQPLSNLDVVTKITVSLNLKLMKKYPIQPRTLNPNKCQSITFQTPPTTVGSANTKALVAATQLVMTKLEPIIDMDGAKCFNDLIGLFKVAKKDDILSAFLMIENDKELENVEMTKKVFINALIAANCGESIEAIAELVNNNMLSDSLAHWWLSNLVNAKQPTKEAVLAASSLLNDKVVKENYMGVGALLNTYLKDTEDYNSAEVRNILNNLGVPLERALYSDLSPDDQDLVIASIKGLGNAQYINNDIEDSIVKIITNKAVLQRIRVATLKMVKIYAQNPKMEKACESILLDTLEDSELRILAFKVFAINPSNYKATVIKNILDDKNCQLQIRAFIRSYLKNIHTTIDEDKLDQKAFYEGLIIKPKKMLNDILRYSQNLEFAQNFPFINSSVLLDSDVIYSYESFLARSSSVKLKATLFGNTYEIFNFDIRCENIELILEKLLGPEGYFSKNEGQTINDIKNYINQAINYVKNKKLSNGQSDLSSDMGDQNLTDKDLNKIYLDIGLQVFKQNVGWFAFHNSLNEFNYQNLIDAIFKNVDNLVPDKKNIDLKFTRQLNVIDYENKYATCSGLPVSLKIQGTSAIKLNTGTKFDLDDYLEHPENIYFSFKLFPSGSLTLNTLLTIDGSVVEVGHKTTSSIHTSTGFNSVFEAVKGRDVKIVYELPLKEMDVFSIKSEAFAIEQEKEGPLNEVLLVDNTGIERQTREKTFDNLSKSLGFSAYVKYDLHWNGELKSILPFSGPLSFSFKVLKVDENLTDYIIKANYNFDSSSMKYIKFVFDTPKSDIDRKVKLSVGYNNHHHPTLITQFRTPSTDVSLLSTLVNSDEEKTLEIKYKDGSLHVFKIGVKCEEVDKETKKYTPVFDAVRESNNPTEISTEKDLRPSNVFSDIELQGYVLVKYNKDSQSAYPNKLTLKDLAVITADYKHSLQGSGSLENNELKVNGFLTIDGNVITMIGYIGGDYPNYKMGGTLNLARNEQSGQQLLSDENDDYTSSSKVMDFLSKVKTLNVYTDHYLRIASPYKLSTNNSLIWDDGNLKLNSDIDFEDVFTMYGTVSILNLFDLILNAEITALSSTQNSGVNVFGGLAHSFVSNPSNSGQGNFKFVKDLDNKGNHFKFNLKCPQTLGVFYVNSDYLITDESLKYKCSYKICDNILNADMTVAPNDIKLNIDYDSPNSDEKSSVVIRGLSKDNNDYEFNSKISWPGSQDSNYLIMNGKIIINGLSSYLIGDIDFPIANVIKVQVLLESEPNPEEKDGGLAVLRYVTDGKTLLSEKFKYKLIQTNNGELYISGESIHDDSQHFIPIYLQAEMKNYQDQKGNIGKEYRYTISLENNDQKLIYQRSLTVIKNKFAYKQLKKINNEEQLNKVDLEYDIKNPWDWSYDLKAKIVSQDIFKFLTYNSYNSLEFDSSAKMQDYTLNKKHIIKINSFKNVIDSYEFKLFINNSTSEINIKFGNRTIRNLAHYSFTSNQGVYRLEYSENLWLDYSRNSDSKSSLSIESQCSFNDGLSAFSDINIMVPSFNDKIMSVKSDIEMFKSYENPFYVKLDLDIFSSPGQAIILYTSLNRNVQDNGVLYSAELLAKSYEMRLHYSLKESILVSNKKWGNYLDVYFMDSYKKEIPVQLHGELMSTGFISKLNIFNVMRISVDSSINVKDTLNIKSTVIYNECPNEFKVLMTSFPSFKCEMAWNDKMNVNQKLVIEGSLIMDDSAVISGQYINGNDIVPMGSKTLFLSEKNWLNTDMVSNEWTPAWESLKNQYKKIFINIHSNLKNIKLIAKKQRKLRMYEGKAIKSQYHPLVKYIREECNQISNEIYNDDYILYLLLTGINVTKMLLIEPIDLIGNFDLTDSLKNLGQRMDYNLKHILNLDSFKNYLKSVYDKLFDQANLTLHNIVNLLYQYIDKLKNDFSSKSRSIDDYSTDFMDKLMNTIQEYKRTITEIQDYIKKLSIYDQFQNQIEMLKSYPYKDKLYEEIHKYLNKMEMTAPTKVLANFINALDKYIENVINDIDVPQEDMIDLKNKGLAVTKSILSDFPNYVDYNTAISIYNTLCKFIQFNKNILHMASTNYIKYQNEQNMKFNFSKYMEMYLKYFNLSNLLPSYNAQGCLIDSKNVITYNNQPYSFELGTGYYVLTKDYVNTKFSVLANYENNNLISIIVLTNDETYELQLDGDIKLNDKNVDLPMTNDNVKLWKNSNFFGIDLTIGVNVKCTLNLNIVEIFVNGYFYSQVRGLLGTMCQEPTINYILPNGKKSNDQLSFLMAYRIQGNTEPTVVDLVQNNQPLCNCLFSGVSTLKNYFSTVSPKSYKAICNNMVSSTKSKKEKLDKACLATKTYATMVKQNDSLACEIPKKCYEIESSGEM